MVTVLHSFCLPERVSSALNINSQETVGKNCGGTLWDCNEKETKAFTGTSHNQNVNVVGGMPHR